MAMTYTTLLAAKAASGSILNWVGYGKIDTPTVLDEAQSLLYSMLRVREMRTEWIFGMPIGGSKIALPARFLDPRGRLTDNFGNRYRHKTEATVKAARAFDNSLSGSFGNNPFTTTAINSGIVTAVLAGHGLNQQSDITIAGATAVDGVTINGTSAVTSVIDANTFQFSVTDAQASVGGVTGGGAAATYTANNLIAGMPMQWAIWDNYLQFDGAFDTATQLRLLCYKSLPLLSATNPNNFLTDRYPQLMRIACMASAASYMKDDNEEQKFIGKLEKAIQSISIEGDFEYMGADLDTETP